MGVCARARVCVGVGRNLLHVRCQSPGCTSVYDLIDMYVERPFVTPGFSAGVKPVPVS